MKVSIIMGSDSDLPIMRAAADFLKEMDIPFDVTALSAHRTPKKACEFAETARDRGVSVIIAGAGGSAHLPGVLAALTTLPVIGVPVKSTATDGVDSLYSIVQMPPGIPVATVGINAARNAGILAASILSVSNKEIADKLEKFKKDMNDTIVAKNEKLQKLGYEEYLAEK